MTKPGALPSERFSRPIRATANTGLRASVRHTAVDPVEVRRQDANRRHGRGEFIMSRRSFNPERPGAT